MHAALFHDVSCPQLSAYYGSIRDRLLPMEGKRFGFRMSSEDFYLYMLAHTYKHDSNGGTGLRSLLDVYIYRRAKPDLNQDYLNQELEKLGLKDFAVRMETLAAKTFQAAEKETPFTAQEQSMLRELTLHHTYGTVENAWRKRVRKETPEGTEISARVKWAYFRRRLFPSKAHMEKWCELYAPFFLRHRYLLPAARIARFAQLLGKKGKTVQREFDTVRKM